MTIDARTCRTCLCLLPVLAAVGCSNPSLLGISADVNEEQSAAAPLTTAPIASFRALQSTTVISGNGIDHPWMRRPSLGDVDGDGFDDFLVEASWIAEDSSEYGVRSFLFYGREDLPAQLSTADADAVFDTGELPTVALGDINGDGFADFALGDWSGYEIIFGSSTRLTGTHKRFETGLVWTSTDQSQFHLRALGDVNGDGADELLATVISAVPVDEAANRQAELITDYLIAGRKEGWPTGQWDNAWAVAQLGDEPPAFENNGATTVLQRMTLAGKGDLDGDGYTDLLALGRWRMWVFYGSERGFQGTLSITQADASLTWLHDPADRRAVFAKTIPFIVGDLDSDGTADIAVPNQAELGIAYGTKRRWSGRVQLEPELTLVRATTELPDQNWWLAIEDDISHGYPLPELVTTQIRVGVADLDGDAQRELIIHENRYPSVRDYNDEITSFLYALTGPSKRATGRYVLGDTDLYRAEGVSDASAALSSGLLLDEGGDFDGDGSTDLVFGLLEEPNVLDSTVSLHLVPGTPHNPD